MRAEPGSSDGKKGEKVLPLCLFDTASGMRYNYIIMDE